MNVEFGMLDNELIVKNVESEDNPLEITMNLSVNKKDKQCVEEIKCVNKVRKRETIEPAVLSAKYLSNVGSQIKDIDIPMFNGELHSMHIVPLPEEEFDCDIVSIKMDKKIIGNFKRYILKDRIIIILETGLYKLTWTFYLINGYENSKSVINIKTKINNQSYEDKINEIQVMIDWLTGKELRIYKTNNYKWNIPLPKGKGDNIDQFVENLKLHNKILRNIINVRRYFGIDFEKVTSINKEDVKVLQRLNEIGERRKEQLESISLQLSKISFANEGDIDILKKENIFLFKSQISDNKEVELFGKKINLGHSKIECKDAYISNYDEIKNNSTDELIIKSKRDNLFIQYY